MKYVVMVYERGEDFAARTDGSRQGEYWGAYSAYSEALKKAGVGAGGAALQGPETATTVRIKDGRRHVQDGPYADAKEQLGGFFIIEAADLDAALDWAAKCPAASWALVEVRPQLEMPS
ncbi:MAG: YciI family protein [Bythopirellula sp.]|nr:YciI family protein [Bythopirellula sp.]